MHKQILIRHILTNTNVKLETYFIGVSGECTLRNTVLMLKFIVSEIKQCSILDAQGFNKLCELCNLS